MKTGFRSFLAVLAGIVAVFVLSHLTDLLLERSGFMLIPFNNNPLGLKLFVTFYRSFYVFAGAFLCARIAPRKPMKHVLVFAIIGTVLGVLGAIAMWHLPPHWYPIALVVLGFPSAMLGGWTYVRRETAPTVQ